MSREVDEYVASMQFNNQQFERNVQKSLSTLDKLKQSLKLDGAAKGLETVADASSKLNFSGLNSAVQTVQAKFSALEVIGVTALANITNSAVNAGKRIVKSLTVDQIGQGFGEYELKMGSVQTIMASTGADLDTVMQKLRELNTYSDQTIYSFSDMTSNIGKFTNAGVGLNESVAAIQGVANVAAISGANANEASRAMYNFAQALSSGYVKLIDWKSIENANMATVEFKQNLIDTAVELGTLVKVNGKYQSTTTDLNGKVSALFDSTSMFNDSLSAQWMTTDVLTKTLGEYADETTAIGKKAFAAAQDIKTLHQMMDTLGEAVGSTWAETWELIFGDYEEAKKLWTDLSNALEKVFVSGGEARNEMLSQWKDLGGRDALIQAFWNAWNGVASIIGPIKEGFRDIFPPMTAETLLKMTETLKEFAARLTLSDTQSKALRSTFKGLFAILDIGATFVKKVISGFGRLLGIFNGFGTGVLGATGSLGEWLSKIRDSIKETDAFGKAVNKLVSFLESAVESVKGFFSALREKISIPGIEEATSGLEKFWKIIQAIGKAIGSTMSRIGSAIAKVFRNGDIKAGVDLLNGGIIAAILLNIRKFTKGLGSSFDNLGSFIDGLKATLDSVRGCFEAYQEKLKAGALLKIAAAIAILAVALVTVASIDPDRLTNALGGLSVLFAELLAGMALFNKIGGETRKATKSALLMVGMSVSILILASALSKLSGLDWEGLARGVVGVGALLAELIIATKILQNGGKGAAKGASQMVLMAAALKILASVCADLASLSWTEMAKGLVGVGILLAELSIFLRTAKFSGKALSTATGIVILSAALKVLASVCGDFASMEWGGIGKGLASIGALLAELVVFTKLTSNAQHMISTGVGLIAIAAAMKIFANVMGDFGQMSWTGIAKGLVAMAGALLSISVAMRLLPKGTAIQAVGLIGVAAAIVILGKALSSMSGMSWPEIGRGLAALGGSLLILAVGLNAMKGTIAASASLLVAAAALAVLAPVIKAFGSMSLAEIGKSLLVLAGAFIILGVAGAVLAPLVPAIMGLSTALLIFGAGCALVGAGVLALSIGLTSLGGSLVVIAASIVTTITTLILGLGDIIVSACSAITASAPAIAEALVSVAQSACYALTETAPVIAETAFTLLVEALRLLKNYTPQVVDLLADVLIGLIDSLSLRIPELVNSALNLIGMFMASLNDALGAEGLQSLISSLESVALVFIALGVTAKVISTIPISGAITGVASLAIVVAGIAALLAALGGLAQIPGFTWLIGEGSKVLGQIGTAIGEFVGNIVGGVSAGVTSALPQVGQNLSDFMESVSPFVEGLRSIDGSILASAGILAGAVLAITAADVISGIASWVTGGSSLTSFGADLAAFGPYFKQYADSIAGIDSSSVSASANAASALAQMAASLPNSGGLVSWFTGENSIASFGGELVDFGTAMKSYADSVAGIDAESVTASATAAKALAEMANTVPNEGGVAAWFAGENSLAKFGNEMVAFGTSLMLYSLSVSGVDPEAVLNSVTAGKALSELANTIPNEGGIVAWFTGENSLAKFGQELIAFGVSLLSYSLSVVGVDTDAVKASVESGKALAELADTIPNEGGLVAWFTGENSLAKFGTEVSSFGASLKAYSDSVVGIDAEAVKTSAIAGKALAEMANTIPNEGGVAAWFAGENSLSKFGVELASFGLGIKMLSDNVSGIKVEEIRAVVQAGIALAGMADTIPNEGGIVAWFTGENSLAKFGAEIAFFGFSIKSFSDNVTGIKPQSVKSAAEAGKALAEMASVIPNEGGIVAWFTGENSLAKFGSEIAGFGKNIKDFADNLGDGINGEVVKSAAIAGKYIAEMASVIPNEGGVVAWFSGDNSLAKFGNDIARFGKSIKNFADNLGDGIDGTVVKSAAEAGKSLAEMASVVPNAGGVAAWFAGENSLASFGSEIASFGTYLKEFSDNVTGLKPDKVTAATDAAKTFADIASVNVSGLSGVVQELWNLFTLAEAVTQADISGFSTFADDLKALGQSGVDKFIEAFTGSEERAKKAGSAMMDKVQNGIESKETSLKSTINTVVVILVGALKSQYSAFYNAGAYLVDGFGSGISMNTYKASAQARAMANAAAEAARKALDEHSPSKVGYKIGDYFGMAFVDAIGGYARKSYSAAYYMADSARNGLGLAASRISDTISADMDTEPVIRPVLDLSDVSSGMGRMNRMFGVNPSIEVLSNIGAIQAGMNQRQNTGNADVISALKELGSKLGKPSGDTYNINGVSYDDGSNVSEAVKVLVRAARVERRR